MLSPVAATGVVVGIGAFGCLCNDATISDGFKLVLRWLATKCSPPIALLTV